MAQSEENCQGDTLHRRLGRLWSLPCRPPAETDNVSKTPRSLVEHKATRGVGATRRATRASDERKHKPESEDGRSGVV